MTPEARLAMAEHIVAQQAADTALWNVELTEHEAYLQRALRRLSAAIEGNELMLALTSQPMPPMRTAGSVLGVCQALRRAGEKWPHQRAAQLMFNALDVQGAARNKDGSPRDIFYIDDETLSQALLAYALSIGAVEELQASAQTAASAASDDRITFLHTWMRTPNPMLGNVSPLSMMKAGLGRRLAAFIEEAYEAQGGKS